MTHRDEHGHFISDEEAERRGLMDEDQPATEEETEEEEGEAPREWAEEQRATEQPIIVDTGRGQTVEVQPGAPFVATLERLANEAHYGGYFRIFLNGSEVINPEDSPETIEPGMRLAITSYDKVG